jgi:DNA-binding transcriptional LysR family regulator
MPSTQRLHEFAAIVSAGSIAGAARVLGMERATLSRHLSGLERELGVRLLHRSTRKLVLTPAGQQLSWRARRIADDAAEAWASVRRMDEVPRGTLRVSTAGNALDTMLIDFVADFPEVRLQVLETTRQVNLVEEGIHAAIRFGPVLDGNLIARRVGGVRRLAVASPAYLDQHGSPEHPRDLDGHRCIVGYSADGSVRADWPLLSGGRVQVEGQFAASGMRLARRAALAGSGLAFLPLPTVRDDLAEGALATVLEDLVGDIAVVSVVFADKEYIEPKVRAFVDRAVPVLERAYGR